MAGTESESGSREGDRSRRHILFGALTGAVVVVLVAGSLGRLIEGAADPLVLALFAVAGGVFGALAWGTVAYERRRHPPVGPAG